MGGSCICHQANFHAGEVVECWRKGRLLSYCYDFGCAALEDALRIAESWVPGRWGGDLQFLLELQGCVRAYVAHGKAQLAIYIRIPFLFSRFKEPYVKKNCEDQFVEVAEHLHDDATLIVMGTDGPLKPDFDALGYDGSGMTVALQDEVCMFIMIAICCLFTNTLLSRTIHTITTKLFSCIVIWIVASRGRASFTRKRVVYG